MAIARKASKPKTHLSDETGAPTFPPVPTFEESSSIGADDVDSPDNAVYVDNTEPTTNGTENVDKHTKTEDFAPKVDETIMPVSLPEFEVRDDLPEPPARKRGGFRKRKFDLDALNVGQGFLIRPTADKPEPWKTYQSTVSAAIARHAVVEGTRIRKSKTKGDKEVENRVPTRKFVLYKMQENGFDVAMIKRTA